MEETLNNQAGQNNPEEPGVDAGRVSKDARMWAMLCHLTALIGFGTAALGFIVGPLVVWLLKRNDFPFVDEQGKEAVNFQISMFIYIVASFLLCFVLIGFVLLPAALIINLIFIITAAIKANDGEHYRYPLSIHFIR